MTINTQCAVPGCKRELIVLGVTGYTEEDKRVRSLGWVRDGYDTFTCPVCLSKGVVASARNDGLYKWPLVHVRVQGGFRLQHADNPYEIEEED
jgi:hypothetical protein